LFSLHQQAPQHKAHFLYRCDEAVFAGPPLWQEPLHKGAFFCCICDLTVQAGIQELVENCRELWTGSKPMAMKSWPENRGVT
jgi:hypothetical protein